jgi:hypothetical protein
MGSMMIDSRMNTLAKVSLVGSIALTVIVLAAPAWGAPLELEAKISLGQVRGRIDHLAVDVTRRRIYVAELGNDTLGVVDLEHHTVLRTLTGLCEPQGVGYEPTTDTVYVASAADGAVHLFHCAGLWMCQ